MKVPRKEVPKRELWAAQGGSTASVQAVYVPAEDLENLVGLQNKTFSYRPSRSII